MEDKQKYNPRSKKIRRKHSHHNDAFDPASDKNGKEQTGNYPIRL